MRYKRTVALDTSTSGDLELDDAAHRLTSLLLAPPEMVVPSSFDHLVRLARSVMQCSIAVALLTGGQDPHDGDVAILPADQAIDSALVQFALQATETMVLSDVTQDERFARDPLVTDGRKIAYFACSPLIDSTGVRFGTLCVADPTPRRWLRSNEFDAMDSLAGAIVADLALNKSRLEIIVKNAELSRMNDVRAMKDEFIAMVSHELRTPLTSIVASLGILEDGILGELSGEVRDVVRVASVNSTRLIALVDDLLDLEKMESGSIDLEISSSPVDRIIEGALMAVRGSAQDAGIDIIREDRLEPGTMLDCDADRIVQVLINLLGNAIKFAGTGTSVTIRTEVISAENLVFSVVDWGEGIPTASFSKLFDPFWQDDSSASRSAGGSGLGLAITKKIVDEHHGRIRVDSMLGIGSTFRVVLPLKAN